METATFGAGCFWGVEAAFQRLEGVVETSVGYTGGKTDQPTYEQVCTGTTGHAEVVAVSFDPEKIGFEELLETFWACHDPTTPNRQGWDVGTQYRSAIFFHSPEQLARAVASQAKRQAQLGANRTIVTEITPAGPYFRAEEYHQKYVEKKGGSAIRSRAGSRRQYASPRTKP